MDRVELSVGSRISSNWPGPVFRALQIWDTKKPFEWCVMILSCEDSIYFPRNHTQQCRLVTIRLVPIVHKTDSAGNRFYFIISSPGVWSLLNPSTKVHRASDQWPKIHKWQMQSKWRVKSLSDHCGPGLRRVSNRELLRSVKSFIRCWVQLSLFQWIKVQLIFNGIMLNAVVCFVR